MLCGGTIKQEVADKIEWIHDCIMNDGKEYSFTTEKKEMLSYIRSITDYAYEDMRVGDHPLPYFYTYAKLWHFYSCVHHYFWLSTNEKSRAILPTNEKMRKLFPDNPYRRAIVEDLNKELLRLWNEAKKREKCYEEK